MPYTVIIQRIDGAETYRTSSPESAMSKFDNALADADVLSAILKCNRKVIDTYKR